MEHVVTISGTSMGYIHFKCACGHSWKNPISWTNEKHDEIIVSHKEYFNKPATVVL